jgi:hypothetical protein
VRTAHARLGHRRDFLTYSRRSPRASILPASFHTLSTTDAHNWAKSWMEGRDWWMGNVDKSANRLDAGGTMGPPSPQRSQPRP